MTPKQQRFIDEYLIDLNATQSAIRAGYSEKTSYSIGQRLLKDVEIAKMIKDGMKARQQECEYSAENILKELASIGFAPIGGEFIRPSDKTKALELLGKHQALFTEKVEHSGSIEVTKIERTIKKPNAKN